MLRNIRCWSSNVASYVNFVKSTDGTTNFAHGYPSFAVSVGVLFRGKPIAAAVVNSLLNCMAVKKVGFLNKPFKGSNCSSSRSRETIQAQSILSLFCKTNKILKFFGIQS